MLYFEDKTKVKDYYIKSLEEAQHKVQVLESVIKNYELNLSESEVIDIKTLQETFGEAAEDILPTYNRNKRLLVGKSPITKEQFSYIKENPTVISFTYGEWREE